MNRRWIFVHPTSIHLIHPHRSTAVVRLQSSKSLPTTRKYAVFRALADDGNNCEQGVGTLGFSLPEYFRHSVAVYVELRRIFPQTCWQRMLPSAPRAPRVCWMLCPDIDVAVLLPYLSSTRGGDQSITIRLQNAANVEPRLSVANARDFLQHFQCFR